MIRFTRTLHPVGQGAFFTEKIVDDKRFTSIVYDCGSTSSRDILYHEIEQINRDKDNYWYGPFNLMFISHFDNDHINGLKKLIQGFFVDVDYIEKLYEKYEALFAESNSSRWRVFRDKSDIYSLVKMCLLVKHSDKQDSKEMKIDDELLNNCRLKKSLFYNLFWNISVSDKPFKEYRLDEIEKLCDEVETENPPHVAVIIPFLYPNLIKVLYSEMDLNDETKDALKALFDSGIKIIGLDDNGNSGDPNNDDIFPNEIIKDKLFDDKTLIVKSFTKIKVKVLEEEECCWYYMPYNTITDGDRKEKFLIDLFDSLMKSEGEIGKWFRDKVENEFQDSGKILELIRTKRHQSDIKKFIPLEQIETFLRDCFSKSLIDGGDDVTGEFVNLLKELYKKASPGINGVTAINVNSLNVLSFCSEGLKEMQNTQGKLTYPNQNFVIQRLYFKLYKKMSTAVQWYKQFMSNVDTYDYYNENMHLMNYSCLYTGDCVMEDRFLDYINFICRRVLRSSIGLLQIPHHGRKRNYNKRLLSKPIFSSFINFNKRYKLNAFAKDIEKDFGELYRPCFEITEKKESKFVQNIEWDNPLLKTGYKI